MKEIYIGGSTNGTLKVDDIDYAQLSQYNWSVIIKNGIEYAQSRTLGSLVYAHTLIINPLEGRVVDHIDGDGLNCTRLNLRQATKSQNAANVGLKKNNTSGYKGVTWNKRLGKWTAQLMVNRINYNLGTFIEVTEAAAAYNLAAMRHFGEFAKLNELKT